MERLMSLELDKQVALESLPVLESGAQRRPSGSSPRISSIMRRMIPIGLIGGSEAPPWSPPAVGCAKSFSELRFDQPEAVAEGERVVVTVMMTGTHVGTVQGVPPTHCFSSVRFTYSECATDKSSSIRHCRDDLGLLRQLGVLPS
jgi:SnoaL-like polyketide cyclase